MKQGRIEPSHAGLATFQAGFKGHVAISGLKSLIVAACLSREQSVAMHQARARTGHTNELHFNDLPVKIAK